MKFIQAMAAAALCVTPLCASADEPAPVPRQIIEWEATVSAPPPMPPLPPTPTTHELMVHQQMVLERISNTLIQIQIELHQQRTEANSRGANHE